MSNRTPVRIMARPCSAPAFTLASAPPKANGCYTSPNATEWHADAHKNFAHSSTTSVAAKSGSTTTSLLTSRSTRDCVDDLIEVPRTRVKGKYDIAWADVKEYERTPAAAEPAADSPAPLGNLTKALDECARRGRGL